MPRKTTMAAAVDVGAQAASMRPRPDAAETAVHAAELIYDQLLLQ